MELSFEVLSCNFSWVFLLQWRAVWLGTLKNDWRVNALGSTGKLCSYLVNCPNATWGGLLDVESKPGLRCEVPAAERFWQDRATAQGRVG